MRVRQYYIMIIGLLSLLVLGCQKDDNQYVPLFDVEVDRRVGLTTDIFSLSVTPRSTSPSNEKLHCRWDWEGDSTFNTKFSNDLEVDHRFLKPGYYKVICEVLSLSRGKALDTLSFTIQQGYSQPNASFKFKPETGHFRTNFLFDASETFDYEDSLETLKFRWDFEDDGQWDTPFLDETTVFHQFELMQDYTVRLNVLDPSQRSGSITKVVELHRTDTCIVPEFTWTSEAGRVGNAFVFDASSSYHKTNPEIELIYKWLFPEHEYTQGSTEPIIEHEFSSPGTKRVILTVEDGNGLHNTVEKEFFVAIENMPPKPKIITATRYGNIETQFYLNLWESRDDRIATSKLLFRWDFDGDGNWDTGKNSEMEFHHQYPSPGFYKCILEAEDDEGLSDTTSIEFQVSPYDYPTSYIIDKRDYKLYGTVKIGDQWWMSENLDYRLDPKRGVQHAQICHEFDEYGSMYAIEFVASWEEHHGKTICPESWHIPSKSEMDELIEDIEYPYGRDALLPMGSSGFNALFSGYFGYRKNNNGDVSTVFVEFSKSTHFLTTSYQPNRVFPFPTLYTLHIKKNEPELYSQDIDMEGYYSLRCVKD